MKLKKLIAAGLMAAMPFALAACADEGDPDVDDTAIDEGVTETSLAEGPVTESTMGDTTETTMADGATTETTAAN